MNYNDLIELIKTKEGYTIEFKENVNSSIGREICSFANANGGKISVRRNPIIVDLIHRLNLVEKAGSGIKRIKKVMKQFELKVEFNISSFFRVVFYRPVFKSEANPKQIRSKFEANPKQNNKGKSDITIEERRFWILNYLKQNKKIKASDIEKKFNIHRDTAVQDLKKIKNVVKKGAGSNVWYEIKIVKK